jgi:hypothetical protein
MPWDNAKIMASTIQSLNRDDIINTWDRLTCPNTSAKITSCVYGTTFPLSTHQVQQFANPAKVVVVNNLQEVINLRKMFPIYDNTVQTSSRSAFLFKSIGWFKAPRLMPYTISNSYASLAIAATIFGAGFIGWSILNRPKKNSAL